MIQDIRVVKVGVLIDIRYVKKLLYEYKYKMRMIKVDIKIMKI